MQISSTDAMLHSALACAAQGIKIVILGNSGTPKAKTPRLKDWGSSATDDENEIVDLFDRFPNANFGALLGPKSQIIDVEFDCEKGQETAERIFGDNFQTPTYQSKRSVHRLFRWSSDFPPVQKFEFEGLEIRLGGGSKQTQSVLPPSIHPDGTIYSWVPTLSISDVDLADVPDEIMVALSNVESLIDETTGNGKRSDSEWEKMMKGATKGARNDTLAAICGRHFRQLVEIDDEQHIRDAYQFISSWNTCFNKPPLDEDEVKATFSSILRSERKSRLESYVATTMPKSHQDRVEEAVTGKAPKPPEFALTIVQGDPATFRLHCDAFENKNKYIELNSAQISSFNATNVQAVEQAFTPLPVELRKKWNSKDGFIARLFEHATRTAPDTALHRPAIIAEAICGLISRASPIEIETLREHGVRSALGVHTFGDGVVIHRLKVCSFLNQERTLNDAIKPVEIKKLLASVNAQEKRSDKHRWLELSSVGISDIRSLYLG